MLQKSIVAKGSGECHPSVDALKECCCHGLWSCSHQGVIAVKKNVVPKGFGQCNLNVDAVKGLWSVPPEW